MFSRSLIPSTLNSRQSAALFIALCWVATTLLLAGCGGAKQPRVYRVHGKLLVKGQPAAGARLTLSPAENPNPALWKMGYPSAVVQPDGSFSFTSYKEGDGAPVGNYKLIATWIEGDPSIPNEDETAPPPKQLLDAQYAQPDTTPWTVVVEPKTNQLDPFEVP